MLKIFWDIYFSVDPEYKGRFTVPTLYDKKQNKIVSNESADIIRMFYTEVIVTKNIKDKYSNKFAYYSSMIFCRRSTRMLSSTQNHCESRLMKPTRGLMIM
jgi:glutathionyl-hydroquinone reductase